MSNKGMCLFCHLLFFAVIPSSLSLSVKYSELVSRLPGASNSLPMVRIDAQGKTHAMALLRMAIEVPDDYDPPSVGTVGALAPRGEIREEAP